MGDGKIREVQETINPVNTEIRDRSDTLKRKGNDTAARKSNDNTTGRIPKLSTSQKGPVRLESKSGSTLQDLIVSRG